MPSGIVNINKPKDYTSFDVVAKLRGILKTKKIGHTGTLDPMATGVLPVCIGKATGVVPLITDTDKVYNAVLLLGTTTDTYDTTGEVLKVSSVDKSEEEIVKAVKSFEGEIEQVPPMYSAKKVGGKKLYELAREGKEVYRKSVKLRIDEIDILEIDIPKVRLRIACQKGTYIRSLCNDIGNILGCGGCMSELTRESVGRFLLEDAFSIADIENMVKDEDYSFLYSIDSMFDYTKATAKKSVTRLLENGNKIDIGDVICNEAIASGSTLRMYLNDGRFVGLYKNEKGILKPVKIFLEK